MNPKIKTGHYNRWQGIFMVISFALAGAGSLYFAFWYIPSARDNPDMPFTELIWLHLPLVAFGVLALVSMGVTFYFQRKNQYYALHELEE